MYAVIETGGKQYRVEVGTELEVELLDVQPGDAITIDRVLLVADGAEASIGRPVVADAVVNAEVVRQTRGEKTVSFKYRPKARSRVKKGHRQELTVLRVTDVRLGNRSAADDVRSAESEQQAERDKLAAAAARQAAEDQALAAKLAASTPTPEAPARRGRATAADADTTETETPKRARRTAEAAETAATEDVAAGETDAEAVTAEATDAEATEAPGAAEGTGADAAAPTEKPHRAPRAKKES